MKTAFAAAAAIAGTTAVLLGAESPLPQFVDIARQAGIAFQHVNGASSDKHLVETMGSGGLFFDYDGDGWIDVFLVDGGSIADQSTDRRARHRLFHNRGNPSTGSGQAASTSSGQAQFEDVTERSGIQHRAYGMGACAGDVDGDGRPDLYITNFGPNTLYRNRGDGTFEDITSRARVGDTRWSASCAFADLDGDGDLDLWVTNYVDADPRHSPFCSEGRGERFYCHPLKYDPLPNTVYRNDGAGVFTDVSMESGVGRLRSNGMGVVIVDADEDGRPDVFVANDSLPNFLFHNEGGLRFSEIGLAAGVAVASDGTARAGMGIDAADYDGDGRLDLVITNLDFQMHTMNRGLGHLLFAYSSLESGIGPPTLPFVGFGVAYFDFDNDGQLDVAVVNGHVLDNAPRFRSGATYAQRKLLFRNMTSRRFAEVGRSTGAAFSALNVGRGLAVGDIDNDGDLDLLITNNGQAAELLRNDGGNRGNALVLRLVGPAANRDAIGARVRVTAGSRTQRRDVKAGSGYLSQNDLRVHIGLGAAAMADVVEVKWPDGRIEIIRNVAANQLVTVREGQGLVERAPLAR